MDANFLLTIKKSIMKRPFAKGMIIVMSYYIIGFFIAYLTSFIPGANYGHGPGLHHLVGFLVLCGGVIWLLYSLVRVLIKRHDHLNVASLILHFIVIGGIILSLSNLFNKETEDNGLMQEAEIKTVFYDSSFNKRGVINSAGDTTIITRSDSIDTKKP